MEFEELQVVWNAQSSPPFFALDLDALHERLKRKAATIQRGVEHLELGMIVISIVTGLILASEPLFQGVDRHQYVSALLFLGVAAYLLTGRSRRRRRERSFDSTLLGDLERAISQVDYHIQRSRTFPLWFFGPAILSILVSFAFKWDMKPWWQWPATIAPTLFGLWLVRWELSSVHLGRKRDLESLRAKLTEPS